MKRETGIDLLKIFSILGVIALHTQRSLNTGVCFNPILYYIGRFAMPIFFMVNGYLILNKDSFDFSYWKKKVLNIIRILIIWSVINAIYFAIAYRQTSIKQLLWNAIKSIAARGVIPFWFLLTFIILYTMLLFININRIKKNIKVITLGLGGICMLFDLTSMISIIRGGYFIQDLIPTQYRLWTWGFYFCLGYYLSNIKVKTNWMHLCGMSIIAFLYQFLLCYVYLNRINSGYCYDSVIIILWSSLLFIQFREIVFSKRWVKVVSFISSNTFGVFLLHQYFIDYFGLTDRVNTIAGGFILWVGISVGCFALSVILGKIPFVREAFKY